MPIEGDIQRLEPGALVDLFELDVSMIDPLQVAPFRFVPMTGGQSGAQVSFRGAVYQPMPIEVRGFATTIRGAMPRPTLTVANVSGTISQLALALDDFRGARLRRIRTFEKYLDGGPEADPLAVAADDVWIVDRKVRDNVVSVEFALASALDWQGQRLPARLIFHNACPWVYEGFVRGLGGGECTYARGAHGDQSAMFTSLDAPTLDPAQDRCGKRLTSCEARFGEGQRLPTGAFPGTSRILR